VSGLKTWQALNKQVSLLQSLADHPYLVLIMEWTASLDDLQKQAISQHVIQQLPETEHIYQDGSRWFWVTHRLTPWYKTLFKLIDSFQSPAPSENTAFNFTQPPHWWIADIESW
ncbi:diguanylate phosphodiesterase, partial [Vibrio cholerae]